MARTRITDLAQELTQGELAALRGGVNSVEYATMTPFLMQCYSYRGLGEGGLTPVVPTSLSTFQPTASSDGGG